MNPKHYSTPQTPGPVRARCPVCREAVYSRAGIHPQCAVRQSEPPRSKVKVVLPEGLAVEAEGAAAVALPAASTTTATAV